MKMGCLFVCALGTTSRQLQVQITDCWAIAFRSENTNNNELERRLLPK
jgi:hypothetical protein